jgi:hypothetical protein
VRPEALFLNGVYESVLTEILEVQSEVPDHVMFLQPYSGSAIARLRDQPPSVDEPMRLLISTTDSLDRVSYTTEIVGWEDKLALSRRKRRVLNRLIHTLQPREGGLYDKSAKGPSINLLYVRRMRRLKKPFSVSKLRNVFGGHSVSDARTTSGGWVYVQPDNLQRLLQ